MSEEQKVHSQSEQQHVVDMGDQPLIIKRRDKKAEKKQQDQIRRQNELADAPVRTENERITEEFNRLQDRAIQQNQQAAGIKAPEAPITRDLQNKTQADLYEETCFECRKPNTLVTKQFEGTLVCSECGAVNQQSIIDQFLEKRNFNTELSGGNGNDSRVGARSSLMMFSNNQDMTTIIAGNNQHAKELNKQNFPKLSSTDKNMSEGTRRIKQVCDALYLNQSDVLHKSTLMLQEIEKSSELKGRSLDAKVGVVIFIASRDCQKPRKMEDIQRYTRTTKQELSKCYKKATTKIPAFIKTDNRIKPSNIVQGAGNRMKWRPDMIRAASVTADNFSANHLCEGRQPKTIAGVAMFLVASQIQNTTQLFQANYLTNQNVGMMGEQEILNQIAKEVVIGAATIKECFQQVLSFKRQLLPENFFQRREVNSQY